ncbi:hypothetical protein [Paenibacillus sp. GYB003]|uniref:hypothetical protein n=1 Tax=Paenibacillus sp. GYB003 TaxID=2994392 RepID=UPI002F961EF3
MERRNAGDERLERLWNELNDPELRERADAECAGGFGRAAFEETARAMERYQVAGPTDEQTQALLTRLAPLLVEPERVRFADRLLVAESGQGSLWLKLIRSITSQVRLFSKSFWIVSAVIMIAGALMMPLAGGEGVNSFFIVSSFVSGVSVFYALRSYGTPMAKLESTFPVSPVEVMTGRLGIIVFYDILLALAASIVLSIGGLTGPLFAFIVSWLVPLCLCTLLAFVAAVRFGPWLGGGLSTAVWVFQLTLRDSLGPFYLFGGPGYPFWGTSRLLGIALTVVLSILAYRLVRRGRGGREAI